jgi:hypothetical protein
MLKKSQLVNVALVTFGTIFGLGITAEKPVLAFSANLTTTFAGGNGLASVTSSGNMFDLNVLSNGITVTNLDVSTNSTGALTVNVYTKLGTYSGSQTNSSAWTLVSTGTATATTSGNGSITAVDIGDFNLSASTLYGVYVELVGTGIRYTNGANTYSNPDIQITTGDGLNGSFGSGGVLSPRTWNGKIYYDTAPTAVPFEFTPSLGFLLAGGGLGLLEWKKRKLRKNQ